jgi:hypothetical protein
VAETGFGSGAGLAPCRCFFFDLLSSEYLVALLRDFLGIFSSPFEKVPLRLQAQPHILIYV